VVSRVDLLADYLRDDAEILEDVRTILYRELLIEEHAVTATVDQGVVRLEGQLERRTMVPSIWDRVRSVEGVVGIDERLTWQLDDTVIPVSPVPWVGF
jgi:osmotically-inducible protein OsmY